MMGLRAVLVRRSNSLYPSALHLCVMSQPYCHNSDEHETHPGKALNHDESESKVDAGYGTRLLNLERDHKQEMCDNHRATGSSFAQFEDLETFERYKWKGDFKFDVEKIYLILTKFSSRVSKLELALQQSGLVLRPGLVEKVLERCGDAGVLGYRFFAWASKQPGYEPSSEAYEAMVGVLGKMRQFGAAWALLEEMRTDNPQLITPEIFIALMRRFASAKMLKNAIQVFDEMPKYGCEADEHVFGCLLDALCKNGNVNEAALLFEEMSQKFEPNLKHFTSLLYGWCQEGKMMEAKVVLKKIREAGFEPDIVVYNNMLSGYAKTGKITDAYVLIEDMREKTVCFPNATSYTIVIQALCRQRKIEEASRLFFEMRRSGVEADVVAYTTLISGFCKSNMFEKAREMLDDMIRMGVPPNEMTYHPIMLAHERKHDLEKCLELMNEMRTNGCPPGSRIYSSIIRLSCYLDEVEEGVKLWKEMQSNGITPRIDAYTVMIKSYIKRRYLTEASEAFKEMTEQGVLNLPQYGTLKQLLNKLLRVGKIEMAKEVWGAMVKRGCEMNCDVWAIWIHALYSQGHVKEACKYCMDMMESDVMPNPGTYAMLIRGLRQLYNRVIAEEITEKVKKMAKEREVTFQTYKKIGKDLLWENDQTGGKRLTRRARQNREAAYRYSIKCARRSSFR